MRHRGSQPHPELPTRDPEADETLALEVPMDWGNGGLWGQEKLPSALVMEEVLSLPNPHPEQVGLMMTVLEFLPP